MSPIGMQGKTIVMTGATSGIGQVAAEELAGMGARLVLVARDKGRAAATLARLAARCPGTPHGVHYADLSRLSEVRRVAAELAAAESRIDLLLNNAGALFGTRKVTEDGLEFTFATNHMAYFLLTLGLRERIVQSAPARIVNTASGAHRGAKLDFADLQTTRGYTGFGAYKLSKLCNILFTRELARRLAGTGVTANCFHPGFVATRFGDESGGLGALAIRLAKFMALSPAEGAKTLMHLAASAEAEGVTGEYFYRSRSAVPSAAAQDDEAARRLWAESEKLAGLLPV
jgi:NAD(P)-dependent dehydrogenase (short-subunit alcohol dehydrogenase family)